MIPYKQTLTHSCLAVCMLMLRNKHFTQTQENDLTMKGSSRIYEFYVIGIPLEFIKKYKNEVIIYVDNKYFADVLRKISKNNRSLSIVQKKITQSLIKDLLKTGSLICHVDDHSLGDYSHASHFIVLERATENFVYIIDPWTGLKRRISLSKINTSINDLKTKIRMCPLLYSINPELNLI